MTSGSMWARLKGVLQQPMTQNGLDGNAGGAPGDRTPFLRGLAMHGAEMSDVQEEVAAEQRGRVALIGRNGELNQWLLALLREQPPAPLTGPITREGFFVLVALPQLPGDAPGLGAANTGFGRVGDWGGLEDDVTSVLADVDLLIYLCQEAAGWQPEDNRWVARLRVLSAPLLPVVVGECACPPVTNTPAAEPASVNADIDTEKPDPPAGREQLIDAVRRQTGVRPILICAGGGEPGRVTPASTNALTGLIERILSLRPRLSIPLAQEAPSSRQMIARRVITTGSLMTALIGAEPIPLLDLPLHVALQWKVALQLAAIYGRPGLDFRSREMAGTVGWNLIVRYTAQQLLKFVPGVGWLLSAAISGVSTWLLGHALLHLYADDRHWRLPAALAKGKTLAAQRFDRQRWPHLGQWRKWRIRRVSQPPEQEAEAVEIPIERAGDAPGPADNHDDLI